MINKIREVLCKPIVSLMIVIFVSAILVNLEAMVNMVTLWLTTDTYMHGSFVIPLAIMMASRKNTPNTPPKTLGLFLSFFIVLAWACLMLVGNLTLINTIQQAAVIATIPMMVLLLLGPKYLWHYRAPLCLLFFAVPFGDFLVPWLQSITADMSVYLLEITNVPVLRNGWYISIPAANFRVAEACSGINFLISTFTVSVFYAFTYMEKTKKRLAFITLGVIVPLVANGLRVYLIIMIAHMGNVEAATGFDHLVYGWIFFLFILIMLFTIGYFWQDPPEAISESGVVLSEIKLNSENKVRSGLCFLALVSVVVFLLVVKNNESKSKTYSMDALSSEIHETDVLGMDFPAADFVSVTKKNETLLFYTAYYKNEHVNKKMVGFQNRWFDGKKWSINKTSKVSVRGVELNKWELVNLSGVKSVLYFGYCIGNELYSDRIIVKLGQAKARALGDDFGGKAIAWLSLNGEDLDENVKSTCSIWVD